MSLQSKKGFDKNYWALALEGSCFMSGISCLATGGAVSLFINVMTGSKTLIGMAVTIQTLFMLVGQLYGAPYVRSIRKLPEFLFKFMAIQRFIPFLMALPLFLGVGGNLSVGIFLALLAIFWLVDGFMAIPWGELCARALKPDLRGHMMGMQVTVGGAASLLIGLLLTWLLATPVFGDNHRFAIIFMLASAILLMSLIFIRLVNDPNPIQNPERMLIRQYYSKIPSVVRGSKPLRRALLARAFSYIGFSSVSFMVVFGAGALNLSDSHASWLVYANIVGGLVGGISIGEVSRRFGNKTVILLCNVCVLIVLCMAASLIFMPGLGYAWLFATCALASLTMSNWVGYFSYFLEIAPSEERSIYQVTNTCIGIPFSFAGYAMGMVIDNFGYMTMFAIGGAFVAVTIILSLRLLPKRSIPAPRG